MFRPLNDDHAIENVRFVVAFRNVISPDAIQKVVELRERLSDMLPAFGLNEGTVEAGARKIRAPVASFAFLRPDGIANWALEVGGNEVAVDCRLYTRWARVWGSASEHIRLVLESLSLAQPKLQIASIELTVRDVFEVDSRTFPLSNLIQEGQHFVSPMLFQIAPPWHCNTGWFDEVSRDVRTLNHLNTDTTPTSPDSSSWAINITHLQQDRLSNGPAVADLIQNEFRILSSSMERLHANNKRVISSLVVPKMAANISLMGEQK